MEAAGRRRVVIENTPQPPICDERLGHRLGQLGDAKTRDRGRHDRLHLIGGETPATTTVS